MVTSTEKSPGVRGYAAPGFGKVADAFVDNFNFRGETGAACAIMIDGETVVDLHGGHAKPGVPWTKSTRSTIFSVSKGVTTILLLMASDRGLLDLDEPVAEYWPGFEVHGKGSLTVRQMLAHRAGLPVPAVTPSANDMRDWRPVTAALASQAPMWEPNEGHAYHALTFGYLAGEVLRRSTGRRALQWLAEDINRPLQLAVSYGDHLDNPERALIIPPSDSGDGIPLSGENEDLYRRMLFADAFGSDIFTASNEDLWLSIENPAANVVSSAHDLAKLFSATVTEVNGIRLFRDEALNAALNPLSCGPTVLGDDGGHVWGTGFMLHSKLRRMAGPRSFGHDGAGGQLAFAHPEFRLGFAFQTAQCQGDEDERAEILSAAVLSCL